MKKIIAIAAASILAACSTTKPVQNADANQNAPVAAIAFPEVKKAWLQEGDFVNVEQLRKVSPGLSKDQVYALINKPHFSEGLFGVKVWNYIFNFRTGNGNEYVTCQYQVQFDKDKKVSSTAWKDQACEQYLVPPPAVIVEKNNTQPAAEIDYSKIPVPSAQNFAIAGDVLFAFNRSSLGDIKNEGKQELDKIAEIIKSYKSVDLVRVVGHTDQLASTEYNFTLSYKRAQTVRKYLVSLGLNPQAIQIRGAGETEAVKPIEECASKNKSALHSCLLPNRRVVIEVIGIK